MYLNKIIEIVTKLLEFFIVMSKVLKIECSDFNNSYISLILKNPLLSVIFIIISTINLIVVIYLLLENKPRKHVAIVEYVDNENDSNEVVPPNNGDEQGEQGKVDDNLKMVDSNEVVPRPLTYWIIWCRNTLKII